MKYKCVIQYHEDNRFQENLIFKIGPIDTEEGIFYWCEDEEEFKLLHDEGNDEFQIMHYARIYEKGDLINMMIDRVDPAKINIMREGSLPEHLRISMPWYLIRIMDEYMGEDLEKSQDKIQICGVRVIPSSRDEIVIFDIFKTPQEWKKSQTLWHGEFPN